ncbi:MAG TPA: malectin domain-containing carbohydrate-binding protein [Candidatus Saccharimonadales bacterium]|nr:malectin domain-containing carbohydrate-binding protein [Candidatus Saccharimonadales bacterium]
MVKKLKGVNKVRLVITAAAAVFLVGGFIFAHSAHKALAACSTGTTDGSDKLSVSVTSAGTYNVWTRLQIPSTTDNSIQLQVDGSTCYTVGGGASLVPNAWTWVDTGTSSSPIQVTLGAGTHTFEYDANEPGIEVDKVLFLTDSSCVPQDVPGNPNESGSNCTPAPTLTAPVYINTGGSAYTDSNGVNWQADEYHHQDDTYGSTGGQSIGGDGTACTTQLANENCTTNTITGSGVDQTIYQTERWGAFHYDIPMTNGTYSVVLKFAEINPSSGTRVFNVAINGATVLSNFNIAQQVGNYTTDDQSFPVTVTNSDLNITFTADQNSAAIDGIEVLPQALPPTPTGVVTKATAYNSVSVNWNAVTTDPGGPGIGGYYVLRNGVSITKIVGATTTSYTDSTVAANTSYSYTVESYDTGGVTSTQSTASNVTTPKQPDTTPPSVPTNVSAVANNPNQVTVTWSASTDSTGGGGIAGYIILRNGAPLNTTLDPNLTYPDTTVSPSTTYNYTVEAEDVVGNVSAASSPPAPVTTPAQTGNLTAPSDLQFSNITPTSLTLSWKGSTDVGGPGVAGYYIIRNGVTVGQVGVVTSYNDTTVLPNTLYTYQVEAFITPTEVSALSPSASITTPSTVGNQKPSAPTSLTAKVVGYNQVNLGWGASTAYDGAKIATYSVYRNGFLLDKIPGTNISYGDTVDTPNKTYTYTVTAIDTNGLKSQTSNSASVTTIPNPKAASLTGTVYTKRSGKPLTGVGVQVIQVGPNLRATTNSDGVYLISYIVPKSSTTVYYGKGGYISKALHLDFKAGKEVTQNVTLEL